jgi:hypothetical protein
MVGLFKNIFIKKKNVSFGEIKPKPKIKRKVVNKGEKQLRVTKINGFTQFYSVKLNRYEQLHLNVFGKKLIKEYPEIIKLLSKDIFNLRNKEFFFDTERLKISMLNFKRNGLNHDKLYRLNLFLKDKNLSFNFFVKIANNNFLANNEFLANQAFQKYGINTIKPHLAFTDQQKNKSVIFYDFSNLNNLSDAVNNRLLSEKEIKIINMKISSISANKNLPTTDRFYKMSVGDFDRYSNVFYKKAANGNIELYFTDLLIGSRTPSY